MPKKKKSKIARNKKAVAKHSGGTKRTPPFPAYPEWSQARFYGFLRSALRLAYNKWPPKYQVLKEARRPYEGEDKRTKWEYKCNGCQDYFKSKEVSVDHIIPAGSLRCPEEISGFVDRLFVGVDGLQVLCKECHHTKTQKERQLGIN